MKNLLIITLSLITVLISNYLGSVTPPFSILFTPVIIGLTTGAILIFSTTRVIWRVLMVAAIIILNDVLIRLYAGGAHDGEGNEWIRMFMLIGAGVAFIFVIAAVVNNTAKTKTPERIAVTLLLPGILSLYLFYFSTFGMVSINNTCYNIKASKSMGVFIKTIRLSDSTFVYANDTFILGNGWVEQQTISHHFTLAKKTLPTNNYNYIIPIKGKFDQYGRNDKIYFQINRKDMNGAYPISDLLTFNADTTIKNVTIYFFASNGNEFEVIKTVNLLR